MTSSAPDYTANPAHLAEQYVIPVVRAWVGDQGNVSDLSASSAVLDFTIEYADGRRGVGDVWLDADATLMATWGDLFGQPDHHQIPLKEGSGTWSLALAHRAKGHRVRREVPDLIDACRALGRVNLDFENVWLPPDADQRLRSVFNLGRSLGVEHLTKHEYEGASASGDVAYYFPKSEPPTGAGPTSVQGWIDSVFASATGLKHVRKLQQSDADERHAVVAASTGTPFSIEQQIVMLGREVPGLVVPDGLTHVWVLPRYVPPGPGPIVALWTHPDGWRMIRCSP